MYFKITTQGLKNSHQGPIKKGQAIPFSFPVIFFYILQLYSNKYRILESTPRAVTRSLFYTASSFQCEVFQCKDWKTHSILLTFTYLTVLLLLCLIKCYLCKQREIKTFISIVKYTLKKPTHYASYIISLHTTWRNITCVWYHLFASQVCIYI